MNFGANKQRHYFRVQLPEILRTGKVDECDAFMDVEITDGTVTVKRWAVIFEGTTIQPDWVSTEIIEHEKSNIKNRKK